MDRKGLSRLVLAASLAISLVAATALGLSLTPGGQQALRSLAAVAGSRIFPWAPVTALANTICGIAPTSGGGTGITPTSGGGTGITPTSGGGTGITPTGGGGTGITPTSGGGTGITPTGGGGTGITPTGGGGTCPPPSMVVSPSSTAVCQGGSVTLTAITRGGALPANVSWSPSTGLSSTTGTTVTASPTSTTSYTAMVTDANGATASSSSTVTVNPLPAVSISGTPAGAIVLGTPVSLTATGSSGSGSYSFAWTKAGVFFAGTAGFTDAPPIGDTTYAVTATDSKGCKASASATVRVFDYTINLSPSDKTVLAGRPATYNVALTLAPGSDTAGGPSSVALSITGTPPGATVSAPTSLNLTGAGSTGTVTVGTALTPLGDFTISGSGSAGGATRMASAGLHVYDFSLAVAPPTQTVTIGGGPALYTVSATLLPFSTAVGLPPSVGLVVIGLPPSVTSTMASSVGFGAGVPLSLAIGSTGPGDYPFTVIGAVPNGGRSAAGDLKIAYNICVLYDQTQVKKAGSTIPIKLQLCDANGGNVSSASIVVHALALQFMSGSVPPVTPDDSGAANPDNDFRFDTTIGTTGGYIFNLSTKGLAPGAWSLTFTAGADPTFHPVSFLLK